MNRMNGFKNLYGFKDWCWTCTCAFKKNENEKLEVATECSCGVTQLMWLWFPRMINWFAWAGNGPTAPWCKLWAIVFTHFLGDCCFTCHFIIPYVCILPSCFSSLTLYCCILQAKILSIYYKSSRIFKVFTLNGPSNLMFLFQFGKKNRR